MNSLTVAAAIALRLAELMSQNQQLEQDVRSLTAQFAEVKDEQQRAGLKRKLSATLEKQFDTQQNLRELEVEQIEARLQKLRELINKRADSRRRIIDNRLEQLLNDAEGLGWGESPGADNRSDSSLIFTETAPGAEAGRGAPAAAFPQYAKNVYLEAIPTNEKLHWRWRIAIPEGSGECRVCAATRGIADSGFPKDFTTVAVIGEGDELFTATLEAGPPDAPRLAVTWGMTTSLVEIAEADARWFVKENRGYATSCAGTDGIEEFDPNKPVVLLRLRAMQPEGPGSYSVSSDSPPGEGLMVWIEKTHQSR